MVLLTSTRLICLWHLRGSTLFVLDCVFLQGSRESIVSYYSDSGEGRFGNVTVTGEVFFGLKYNKHKHQLEVQVHRAKDIAAADEKKGRSDP